MTLFPKMDTDTTADKDEKPDNTTPSDDTDQKQDDEFKVLQLFRDIIAKFSSDDDKKDEGEGSKEEEATAADDSFSPDGLPSRMNSPVPPMYNGTTGDHHALPMPDDTGHDDTLINSADDGGVSLVCIILNASIMQLIFGIICISLGIAAIVIKIPAYHIGDPIWTGILFYVVTGLLGVLTWRFPKDGLVVSYLVMSILSAFASLQLMAIVAFAMRMENFDEQSGSPEEVIRYKLYVEQIGASNLDGFSKSERLALEMLIFFVAFIEMVFVIVMSIVTCKLWPTKTRPTKESKDEVDVGNNKNDFDLKNDATEKQDFNY